MMLGVRFIALSREVPGTRGVFRSEICTTSIAGSRWRRIERTSSAGIEMSWPTQKKTMRFSTVMGFDPETAPAARDLLLLVADREVADAVDVAFELVAGLHRARRPPACPT